MIFLSDILVTQLAIWLLLFVSIGLLSISANADEDDYVSYKGFKVIEIQSLNSNELRELRSYKHDIDYWSTPPSGLKKAIAAVAPSEADDYLQFLQRSNLSYAILVDDLEQTFANERRNQEISYQNTTNGSISFDAYPRVSQIYSYLDQLAKDYPHLVTVVEQATTIEHRPIKYVKISSSTGGKKNKTIFIDAGIHAREWIAPASALYIINQLVENNAANQDLLSLFDWVILPVVNPDGYEFSHTKARLWRKNRNKESGKCVGVDANRNFDFKWGLIDASNDPCSQTFRGSAPFSEVESQAIRDIVESLKSTCKMYLSFHSYARSMLYQWGHTNELPDTWRDIDEVARAGSNAIQASTGTMYHVGSSSNVLYAVTGISIDYVYAVQKIPISITIELPGGGPNGFDLPASEIRAKVEETWTGVRAMAMKVNEKY